MSKILQLVTDWHELPVGLRDCISDLVNCLFLAALAAGETRKAAVSECDLIRRTFDYGPDSFRYGYVTDDTPQKVCSIPGLELKVGKRHPEWLGVFGRKPDYAFPAWAVIVLGMTSEYAACSHPDFVAFFKALAHRLSSDNYASGRAFADGENRGPRCAASDAKYEADADFYEEVSSMLARWGKRAENICFTEPSATVSCAFAASPR
jgi:hypothetical protein